jgi:hypothetical protein
VVVFDIEADLPEGTRLALQRDLLLLTRDGHFGQINRLAVDLCG